MYSDSVREVSPWGESCGETYTYSYIGSAEDLEHICRQYQAIKSIFLNREGPICYVVALKKNMPKEDWPPERINGIGVWMWHTI